MQTLSWIGFFIGWNFITFGDAIRCFQCNNIPFPRDCAHLAVCNTHEHCFTEQVITISGNVVYNTGCSTDLRCHNNVLSTFGRRSSNTNRRATDVVTCTECCSGDFCNNKGCGTTEIAFANRGPSCYNCDALVNPMACENGAFCLQGEVCMLYSPDEYKGLPDRIYRSKCSKATECNNTSTTLNGVNPCADVCCNTDFCNNQCLHPSFVPTSHVPAKTTQGITTQPPGPTRPSVNISTATTDLKTVCALSKSYEYMHHSGSKLCIHIILRDHKSWNDAEAVCKQESGELVVLDTLAKAELLREKLLTSNEYHGHGDYWIGANRLHNQNYFTWINGNSVNAAEAIWADGEPNQRHDSCVALNDDPKHSQRFKWIDNSCDRTKNFICEKQMSDFVGTI